MFRKFSVIKFQLYFSAGLTLVLVFTGVYQLFLSGDFVWFDKILPIVTFWLPSPAGAMKDWLKNEKQDTSKISP